MAQFPRSNSKKGDIEQITVWPMAGIAQAERDGFEDLRSVGSDHHPTRGPWLTIVEAARYAGWPCRNGRAPASFYELAQRIGMKLNNKWRIRRDDLDAEIRRHAVPTR
jgi:hypothetical protein